MDQTFTFKITATRGNDVIDKTINLTGGDAGEYLTPAVAAGATVDVVLAMDPDNVICYVVLFDKDVTLTTTNASGSADVINLTANKPIFWHNLMQWTNGHFVNRNAWTKWTFHNAGASDAAGKILILRDSTP